MLRELMFLTLVSLAVGTPISKDQLLAELRSMIASSQPFSCFGRAQAMYSDPADCTMFYECVDGHPVYHRSCALTGTVFDQGDQICDWPANVPPPCGTEPVPVTTEAPPPPPFTCDDKTAGTYPDVTNCRKYWECVPGHPPYNRPCALEELVYNPDTGICDWPRDVVGPCGEQRKRTLNVTDENSGTDENSAPAKKQVSAAKGALTACSATQMTAPCTTSAWRATPCTTDPAPTTVQSSMRPTRSATGPLTLRHLAGRREFSRAVEKLLVATLTRMTAPSSTSA
ncbi:Hypp4615 [Branchiostoma lanceolatum]|uniref:chitinase n=1 Tax=Branchiostoma lanceolatum TaxID=7740 RepID=A0A8K0F1K7_BRALA|nr:Hypp4615 [Branchiostoma lanceolatum]